MRHAPRGAGGSSLHHRLPASQVLSPTRRGQGRRRARSHQPLLPPQRPRSSALTAGRPPPPQLATLPCSAPGSRGNGRVCCFVLRRRPAFSEVASRLSALMHWQHSLAVRERVRARRSASSVPLSAAGPSAPAAAGSPGPSSSLAPGSGSSGVGSGGDGGRRHHGAVAVVGDSAGSFAEADGAPLPRVSLRLVTVDAGG